MSTSVHSKYFLIVFGIVVGVSALSILIFNQELKFGEVAFTRGGLISNGLLVFYTAFIALSRDEAGIGLQKLADSVYYAGFIVTLWSLMLTFNTFEKIPGDKQTHLIALSGAALSTTMVGMIGRIFLVQFVNTLPALENSLKGLNEQIATTKKLTVSLQNELFHSVTQLGRTILGLNDNITNHVTDSLDTNMVTLKAHIEQLQTNLKTVMDEVVNTVRSTHEDTHREYAAKARDMAALSDDVVKEINASLNAMNEEFKKFNGRAASTSVKHMENYARQAEAANEQLEGIIKKLKAISAAADGGIHADLMNVSVDKLIHPPASAKGK